MKVLIIIVTFNGEKWIKNCIDSLINEPYADIFVIDCNSSDTTLQILSDYSDLLKIHISDKNLGFGKANNIGIAYAIKKRYDYVFLVNQDTVSQPGIIRKLIHAHKASPEYGILSPMHFYSETQLDTRFESYLKRSNYSTFSSFIGEKEIIQVEFVNAAFWFIPIEIIKAIGGFDPIFSHYGEDNDFANRVKYIGKFIGIVKNVKGYHLRNQNVLSNNDFKSLKKIYKNQLVVRLKDPNQSYLKSFYHINKYAIKSIIRSIFSSNIHKLMPIITAYMFTIFNSVKIYKHRKLYNVKGYGD